MMVRASRWLLAAALGVCSLGCKRVPERLQQLTLPQVSASKGTCTDRLRCVGAKSALACAHGAEKLVECRGPDGCTQTDGKAVCDNALARTGDACDEEHDFACALDQKAALECQAGVFRVVDAYTGIAGCSLKGDEISCDAGAAPSCDDIEDIACCLSFARRPKAK